MQPNDGVCSDSFEVEQGLRQVCVLSSLLNIFSAAGWPLFLQRFSEDTVIHAELVQATADVDGTGAGYGLPSSCGVGYAVRGRCLLSFAVVAGAR